MKILQLLAFTGTPIQNSIKDLWSLVNFLGLQPFKDKQLWHRSIERPLSNGDVQALKYVIVVWHPHSFVSVLTNKCSVL